MLRGKFPTQSLPPVYDSYKDNLLAELAGTYNVSAAETITALCPAKGGTPPPLPEDALDRVLRPVQPDVPGDDEG